MNILPTGGAMTKLQAVFFLPILLAFTAGSLPILLPLALYRWASGGPVAVR